MPNMARKGEQEACSGGGGGALGLPMGALSRLQVEVAGDGLPQASCIIWREEGNSG